MYVCNNYSFFSKSAVEQIKRSSFILLFTKYNFEISPNFHHKLDNVSGTGTGQYVSTVQA